MLNGLLIVKLWTFISWKNNWSPVQTFTESFSAFSCKQGLFRIGSFILVFCLHFMVTIVQPRFVAEVFLGITAEEMNSEGGNCSNSRPGSGSTTKSNERSACFLSNMKSILPCELSKLITEDSAKRDDVVLIDCRSFMEYSSKHITGAFHLNCTTGIVKRRLTQGKVKVHDLFSSDKGKERFLEAKVTNRPVVVYDGASNPAEMSSSSKPISVVTRTLLSEGTNTLILQGGLKEFLQQHHNLCDVGRTECESLVGATARLSCSAPCSIPDKDSGPPVSEIIPQLYIGNKSSASDEHLIDSLGIKFILNVTKDHPNYFEHRPDLVYKQISVNDSSQEDIGAHFEEALWFIDEGRKQGKGILVHCQAGISRSATIVIAFLMKYEMLSLNDAYKLVKEKRPVISPNLNFMGSLLKYEKTSFRR